MAASRPYVGRFAPSPTGPLHAGSLVAALASWLDARAHGGRWLVRVEDVDGPRCPPGTGELQLRQLARCGLLADAPPWWQSDRDAAYQEALARLVAAGLAYPCHCSRRAIEQALQARGWQPTRHGGTPYPGTCRPGSPGVVAALGKGEAGAARIPAWRLRTDRLQPADGLLHWQDRRLGSQHQDLALAVGDVVLRRADGLWAYQLAVVVDDGAQGVTDVVRGEDLADNTPRQIHLQHCLGLPLPRYLHTPLVLAADGQKLSKQNGAQALDLDRPLLALRQAAAVLGLQGLPTGELPLADWLAAAVQAWPWRPVA
ncbi:tRNA glutamyl-Q(34) synthetase GluQRS [Ideonella livida]|uniref:Glutamyl-Q tRNA(Asp) synthetase n=1 Tax=Ideonella livida TaxID=2707176 RepID=A0A7C9TKX7_9BURK|nr:tRNA glutamyl-Q(34) synthetase GluQRS [Ideonella livida]NDY91207.1 tRNA glutamyl-Q(34) synthetase GluQRS [Ideonella livida]